MGQINFQLAQINEDYYASSRSHRNSPMQSHRKAHLIEDPHTYFHQTSKSKVIRVRLLTSNSSDPPRGQETLSQLPNEQILVEPFTVHDSVAACYPTQARPSSGLFLEDTCAIL